MRKTFKRKRVLGSKKNNSNSKTVITAITSNPSMKKVFKHVSYLMLLLLSVFGALTLSVMFHPSEIMDIILIKLTSF